MNYSLRRHAACVGASGNFNVMRDVLGMIRSQLPPNPSGGTTEVSLRNQMDAINGRHIHLNVIKVGADALATNQRDTAYEQIDFAVMRTREIYKQVEVGVGRVKHWSITASEAQGYDDIGSTSEAKDLWASYYVDNNGLDVFMVRTISDDNVLGYSPVNGTCNKKSKRSGLIGGRMIGGTHHQVARTFAHEIGHYLKLKHPHGANPTCSNLTTAIRNRLMTQTRCSISEANSTNLTTGEGTKMRSHCSVKNSCS